MLLVLLSLQGCKTEEPSPLFESKEDAQFVLKGLRAPATVVYTEYGIPHIYAENREDLYRAQGFVVATDRFFSMDLVRRLSTGRISALLGELGLKNDIESRSIGMTFVTDLLLENFSEEEHRWFTAYAEGMNDYIAAVKAGDLPPPSEYVLAGPLVGANDPVDLMEEWTERDIAAFGGTILYRLGYETDDISRADDFARIADLFEGDPFDQLRTAGAYEFWRDVTPVFDEPSAPGFGHGSTPRAVPTPSTAGPAFAEKGLIRRARTRMEGVQERFGRDKIDGWGSNSWAVAGNKTTDGRALLAGDGHLELDIPALMYPVGLNTRELGGPTGIERFGMLLVGMPVLGVGTNGRVAWSSTQHSGDITDWYAEEIQLDSSGKPTASFFQGEWKPLEEKVEQYEIADIPLLGSTGRTEQWSRFVTFDDRWILDIEGEEVESDASPGQGETLLALSGSYVIPKDMDNDGKISAISFDFTGFDKGNLFTLYEDLASSRSVVEFNAATRKSQALSQNLVAADSSGNIYYTGYEMVPCRDYLPRDGAGSWLEGADPTMLLDGSTYGGFTIPVLSDFGADESDPAHCVVPFQEYPRSFTPPRGYLVTANQDPGGIESDGNLLNDPYHIGGPWDDGYRAHTIGAALASHIDAGTADLDAMSQIQSIHASAIGQHHLQDFLGAIDAARSVSSPAPHSSDERLATLYHNNQAAFDEVYDRLTAWGARGHEASSGVETFYNPDVSSDDRADSVATTIFNVWLGDLVRLSISDENFPGKLFQGGGTAGRLRILDRMFAGRGPGNPRNLASYNPDTEESIFWDIRGTEPVEESDEVVLLALVDSLHFLASEPTGDAEGGFGTDDMSAWIWGLRHQVEFKSLIGGYIDDPLLGPIFADFAVSTDRLPLAESLPAGDPRRDLTWFPRPGDNRAVDAANPGLSGRRFRHGSGPVMRMAFALGPDGVSGYNVIPGGQSGIKESEHYADQSRKWLANETIPIDLTVDAVLSHATRRITFNPESE